jgi:Outer membrane protein beta-barrel domain
MKKFYFSSILILLVLTGSSQTEKGNWMLGGNIQFSSNHQTVDGTGGTLSTFALNPKIGFFPVNNLAVILNTTYLSQSIEQSSYHTLLIGPAVRYYIPASESVKFFFGTGLGFGSGNDYTSTAWQFEAGPSFFLSRMVAVEMNISYQTESQKASEQNGGTLKSSLFGVGLGFMIYLGKGTPSHVN